MAKLALIVAVSFTPLLAATLTAGGTSSDGSPNWYRDYPEARSVAKETGKPLFVTFR